MRKRRMRPPGTGQQLVPVIEAHGELRVRQRVDHRPIHFDSIVLGQWILLSADTTRLDRSRMGLIIKFPWLGACAPLRSGPAPLPLLGLPPPSASSAD
jgi:hypothetical protein